MAIQFTLGSSQYLTTSAAPATAIPITMACAFNPAVESVNGILMSLGASSGNFDRLVLGRNAPFGTDVAVSAQSVSASVATSAVTDRIASGQWSWAAGVYQSSNKQAFLNGTGSTAETSAYTLSGIDQLTIGARRNSGGFGVFCNVTIAEAAIWTAALSDPEIAALSRGFTPDQIRPQSLVFYAPLIRDLQDLRGGLTITNNNGATAANHPRIIQ